MSAKKNKKSRSDLNSVKKELSSEKSSKKNTKSSIKLKLIAGALILLILALGFNVLLSLSSLEKLYVESIVSKYSVIAKDFQRKLENALRFGKHIEKFVGMDNLLEETKRNLTRKIEVESTAGEIISEAVSESDVAVSIFLPNGFILYSTDEKLRKTSVPEPIQKMEQNGIEKKDDDQIRYVKHEKDYFISFPIRGGFKKDHVATAIVSFSETQIRQLLKSVLITNLKIIAIILLSGSLLLIIFLSAVLDKSDIQKFPKTGISIVMFLVIGISQIIFTGLNTNSFKNYYLKISKEKTAVLATLLKEEVEFFLSKGLRIEKLVKMDVTLGEIISAAPELDNITITDSVGTPLYTATQKGVIDFQRTTQEDRQKLIQEIGAISDPRYNLLLKLLKDKKVEGYISADSYQGFITTNISKKVLFSRLKEIILDSATILIISFLFFVELLILIFQYIEKQVDQLMPVHYGTIRPSIFLFFFGYNTCTSFLPLYIEQLYEPLFNLSKDMVMGLPISMTVFFGGISPLIAGPWVDKRGWHEAFFTGVFLTASGFFYSWLAPNALHLIISRGFVGLGYGFTFMAAQGFVITYTDEESKAQGLTRLIAGCYAGYICGSATGAMLAERIGYNPVFLMGSIIVFSVIMYAVLFMKGAVRKPEHHNDTRQYAESASIRQIFDFVFDRNIFSLSLFFIIPTAMVSVGFLYYFVPIYLNRLEISQSAIGRLLMVHGLFFIYVAPFISKYIDASANKKRYIVVSGILSGIALITFYFFGGYGAAAITVLLMGFSGSFDAGSAYALKLRASQKFGGGKTIAYLSSMEKVGQVFGPIGFGLLFAAMEISKGITYLGLAYLFVILIFLFSAQNIGKK